MHNNMNVNVSGPVQPTSTYKTKVLKGNHSFASQVTEPNMKYVIKHDFVLDDDVTIPENCILEFDGGSISGDENKTLTLNDTIVINESNNVIFDNVGLLGTSKSTTYTSWFKTSLDDTDSVEDAIRVFNCVIIDRNCHIGGHEIYIENKQINLIGYNNSELLVLPNNLESLINIENCDTYIEGIIVNYQNNVIDYSVSGIRHYCLNIKHSSNKVVIKNSTLKNYGAKEANQPLSSFYGFCIQDTNKITTIVENCCFKDCIVRSDGIPVEGVVGADYPLFIHTPINTDSFGIINVSKCYFENIYTIDENGDVIVDDASALYIQGEGRGGDISISDCLFFNVNKRATKLQCNNVVVKNCRIINDSTIPIDNVLNIQGGYGIFKDCYVDCYGVGITLAHGDHYIIDNCTIINRDTSKQCISTDGYDVKIKNCKLYGYQIIYYVPVTSEKYSDFDVDGKLIFEGCNIESTYRLFATTNKVEFYNCVITTGAIGNTDCISFSDCIVRIKYTDIAGAAVLNTRKFESKNTTFFTKDTDVTKNLLYLYGTGCELTLDNCVFNLTTKFINNWITIYSSSDTNPSTIKKILLENVEFIGYPSGTTNNRYLISANRKCIFSGEVFIIDSCITDSPYMNIVNFLNMSGGICKVQNTKVTSINNNSTIVENPIQVLYKNSYTIKDIYDRKYPLLVSSVVNL